MILLLLASGGALLVAIVALFELKAARERRRMALKGRYRGNVQADRGIPE